MVRVETESNGIVRMVQVVVVVDHMPAGLVLVVEVVSMAAEAAAVGRVLEWAVPVRKASSSSPTVRNSLPLGPWRNSSSAHATLSVNSLPFSGARFPHAGREKEFQMATGKRAALQHAPIAKTEREPAAVAKKPEPARLRSNKVPDRFTYALKQFTAERREDGWWISRTWTASFGEKPQWRGPFATIETACLAIARRLATEIADRHTHSIEWHGLKRNDPRYGLKLTTRLRKKCEKEEGTDD